MQNFQASDWFIPSTCSIIVHGQTVNLLLESWIKNFYNYFIVENCIIKRKHVELSRQTQIHINNLEWVFQTLLARNSNVLRAIRRINDILQSSWLSFISIILRFYYPEEGSTLLPPCNNFQGNRNFMLKNSSIIS